MSRIVKPSNYWDLLPPEIKLYIIQLADRAEHRDNLCKVHQVLERFWDICNCGPFHVLREIQWSKKWKICCGIRAVLKSRNRVVFKHQICCRRPNPIYQRFAEERRLAEQQD